MEYVVLNFMAALMLTGVTGSVYFLAWLLTRLLFERFGAVEELYRILWVCVAGYLCPVIFLYYWWRDQWSGFTGALPFLGSPDILRLCRIGFVIWAAGAFMQLLHGFREILSDSRLRRGTYPLNRTEQAVFDRVCREMHMRPGSVRCAHSYHAESPAVVGRLQPMVVLPAEESGERKLRVALLHEMMHYRQKDLWLKAGMELAGILHWCNPLVWVLLILLERWCEYTCDFRVCRNYVNKKEYFAVILEYAERRSRRRSLRSRLIFNRNELERRVRKMNKCLKEKRGVRRWAVGLFAVLMAVSSVTASAAGHQMERQFLKWEEVTREEEGTDNRTPARKEGFELPGEDGIREETGETEYYNRGKAASFEWTVGANTRKATAGFSVSAGETINIMASGSPSSSSYRVGVVLPNGSRKYVSGSGTLSYVYTAATAGTHKVYVQNTNSTSISVTGTYYRN